MSLGGPEPPRVVVGLSGAPSDAGASGGEVGDSVQAAPGLNPVRVGELREALGADVLRQLLMTFRIENQGRLARLRAAADSSTEEVGLVAHEVQGAAASVGADRLAFAARELVQAARREDDAAVVDLTRTTVDEMQEISRDLADHESDLDADH